MSVIHQTKEATCLESANPAALPRRVLHVIDNLKLGGAQALTLRIMHQLENAGVDVHLCCLRRSGNQFDWDYRPQVTYLNFHGDYRRPLAISRCASKLAKVVREFQPDLLHSYLWLSDVVTATSNRKAELPHVAHIVDRREWQTSRKLKHRYRRWLTRRAFSKSRTRFLAVSQAAAEFAVDSLKLDPQLVGVAANSIDTEAFLNIEDSPAWKDHSGGFQPQVAAEPGDSIAHDVGWNQADPIPEQRKPGDSLKTPYNGKSLVLGIAGRLEPEKGHAYLFEAVAELAQKNVPVRLLVTGDGSQRNELVDKVRQLGIEDRVEFIGWLDDVRDFWKQIDVFMVPSVDSEGLPTTILEAMASGKVVIASDVGGAVEAVRDQVDGLIVPPRDVDSLVQAVAQIYQDQRAAQAMCRSARQRVQQHFSTPIMMQKIRACYAGLLTPDRSQ